MRLYATVTSERGGRPVKKGGDKLLMIDISRGNKFLGTLNVRHLEHGYDIFFNGLHIQGGDDYVVPDKKQAKT